MSVKFKKLNIKIINCKKCPRLIKFSKKISLLNIKKIEKGFTKNIK